jgi:hypothetical protein
MFMSKIRLMALALCGSTMLAAAAPSNAVVYLLSYHDATNSVIANLTVTLPSDGAAATAISGTRNGLAVTGLSSYASADQTVTVNDPHVTFGGLSFTTTAGIAYNFYYASGGVFGSGGYGEINGLDTPGGSGVGAFPLEVTLRVVDGVPEAASWAMMIAGFGLVGAQLRRRPSLRIAYSA